MEIRPKLLFKISICRPNVLALGMLSVFIFASCNFNKNKNPMLGNWYGYEEDSTYYELYVNDSLIVLHHQNIGPMGYDYTIDGNLLVVSNEAGMERVWQVLDDTEDTFTLTDSLESIKYTRLSDPMDFFKSIQDSVSYKEFKKGFYSRFSGKNKAK
ncbi:hypothetical protein M3O96_21235 [Aquiflexum sp. TKW24L]|uniref:hypothetical protein n=1 Tax=Aquiflexum sp. TKW24L TaxID=2942212 RepID=UPI0020BDDA12|nr:hypothetical protein [Aquiflexum sp. TKW24L]MCL6261635.1 hypothetical protein [Aquiflexum sp. TKW24L]